MAKETCFAKQEHVEKQVRKLIEKVGFKNFVVGVHNACAHGKVFEKDSTTKFPSDKKLGKLFKRLEKLVAWADKQEV